MQWVYLNILPFNSASQTVYGAATPIRFYWERLTSGNYREAHDPPLLLKHGPLERTEMSRPSL